MLLSYTILKKCSLLQTNPLNDGDPTYFSIKTFCFCSGRPSSSGDCFQCHGHWRGPGLCLQGLHVPQGQVLGEVRRVSAQRCLLPRSAAVEWNVHVVRTFLFLNLPIPGKGHSLFLLSFYQILTMKTILWKIQLVTGFEQKSNWVCATVSSLQVVGIN